MGGGGDLKVELKGGKTHISKLAYKCMRHENTKPICIKKWCRSSYRKPTPSMYLCFYNTLTICSKLSVREVFINH